VPAGEGPLGCVRITNIAVPPKFTSSRRWLAITDLAREDKRAFSSVWMASAAEAALAELAACSPAELSRVVRLHQVHVQCAAAGVLASAAGLPGSAAEGKGSVAELHDLFDASVQHGMHQLVCHYVDEVCGHEGFSSPDGVEVHPPQPPPHPVADVRTEIDRWSWRETPRGVRDTPFFSVPRLFRARPRPILNPPPPSVPRSPCDLSPSHRRRTSRMVRW